MPAHLPAVPVVDIRDGGPRRHARESAGKARALRDACLRFFPRAALPFVPSLDRLAQRWLERFGSPYVPEIADIAAALGFSGIWLLNASYQWGCTSLAGADDGVPWLLRTLDWPFTGLGHNTEIALMRGACGDFVSITWPGYVGVLTAMAPHRFAACVNQAPLWRRTRHPWLRPYDFAANAVGVWRCAERMPPDQLLRRAFETCADYGAARRMLEETPVARPVIYTLIGCAPREHCVIERTEDGFTTREEDTSAANDWLPRRPGWEGRIGTRRFLKSSFAEAGDISEARRAGLANWRGAFANRSFDWLQVPVLNPYTRLAAAMCPADGIVRAIGYDMTGGDLPEPVTQVCDIDLPALLAAE
jgi:hypothetical protein